VPLTVAPLDDGEDFARGAHTFLAGSTRDLSAHGLTLLLPAVRVGSRYLTDAEGYLGVKLETPSGPVSMLAAPARFEQLPTPEDGYGCLLGVRIIKMGDGDRAAYLSYLQTLAPRERRSAERKRVVSDSLQTARAWSDVTPASVAEAFERFLRNNMHT
jgi:hypothetical protein